MTLLQYLSTTVYRHYIRKLYLAAAGIKLQSAIFINADFRNPQSLTNSDFRNPQTLTSADFETITEIT